MKQTAVEWLQEQLIKKTMSPIEAIKQAKAMEKEQIIYAYLKDRRGEFDVVLKLIDEAEQYYNETFKSE
jgi:hypothetical protein